MSLNAIVFRMNVSPITVHYFFDRPNIFSFIMRIFSVVGGLFIMAKVFDTLISSSWKPKKVIEADAEDYDLGGPTLGKGGHIEMY